MMCSTTAAEDFKAKRLSLRLSQSSLARLSGVSRFKICTFELGGPCFKPDEQTRLRDALSTEAARLSAVVTQIKFNASDHTEKA